MKLKVLRTFAALTAVMCLSSTAYAQFDTATVLGAVRDNSQSAIAGATVTLTNVATGVAQTMSTSEAGEYEFFNVKIGKYKVTGEARGFKKGLADEFTVTV